MKLILSIIIALQLHCYSKSETTESYSLNGNPKKTSQSNETFEVFYNNFYSNKTFQLSRIITPLKGELKYIDENDKVVFEKWKINKDFEVISYSNLKKQMKNIKKKVTTSNAYAVEQIWIQDSGFTINRKFEKRNGKWYLVYYKFEYI
ncbi:DUF4348 domain-containing protein [Hymenobacter sp. J193]|uniref:DUF4348 domain-containing protein n=1 Tax=Hymenobacter sp. J193 TaxID=2898429 RepID=UPI002150EBBC|nr:DUF4348 domain-containing protein [Hymenobacter sp. J193]MCR5886649.1 DUF4348 domain-containing protein [Hymenobacter sp. J193]